MNEQLEEIKRNWDNGYEFVDDGNEKFQFDKDFNWLIEQAERAQNLEVVKTELYKLNQKLGAKAWEIEQRNKRYREALLKLNDFVRRGEDECNVKQLVMKLTNEALEGEE